MNLEKAGVELDQQSRKIKANDEEQTSVAHIFAIGDVVQVRTNCVVHLKKTCLRCLCRIINRDFKKTTTATTTRT